MNSNSSSHYVCDGKDPWKLKKKGFEAILRLHLELRGEIKKRWRRALPFGDELFDRWERAKFLGFKKGASIYDSSLVLGRVTVGEDSWVGPFTVLDGRGGLRIGHHCSISSGVQIYSHDSVAWALTGGRAAEKRAATAVGDCTFIGPLSIISAGVRIGDHCVIGANSFVNQNIPAFSIAAGTPAKVIGRVHLNKDQTVRLVYRSKKKGE